MSTSAPNADKGNIANNCFFFLGVIFIFLPLTEEIFLSCFILFFKYVYQFPPVSLVCLRLEWFSVKLASFTQQMPG